MEPKQPDYNQSSPRQDRTAVIVIAVLVALALGAGAYVFLRPKPAPPPVPTPATPAAVRTAAITITKDGFTPASLTVKAGTKVTWTNTDTKPHAIASDPHPAHTGLKGLESANLTQKGTYSFTFTTPGSYTYHDHLNPYKLHGTVVVE